MCRRATVWAVLGIAMGASALAAQQLDWRRIGTTAMDLSLPSLATGPVARVWYSPAGDSLYVRFAGGQVWETSDFETWKPSAAITAPVKITLAPANARPEANARVEQATGAPGRYYALGRFVYRSEDGGAVWTNVTGYRNQSILGEGLTDLAISPRDGDEITVSGQFGVWRSMDGGATWAGLNQGLPNLPARKLLSLPNGFAPARLSVPAGNGTEYEVEWAPGERTAWRLSAAAQDLTGRDRRLQISQLLGVPMEVAVAKGDWEYAGSNDGRLFVSGDRGQTWQPYNAVNGGGVTSIWVSPGDPRIAVASLRVSGGEDGPRVVRTSTGGRIWDDVSANLPVASVYGVAADPESGSIYAATAQGVFQTTVDLANLTRSPGWQRIGAGLPDAPALDVRLDDSGNQLFVLLEGYGVYATMSPHRLRELRIVNAADFSERAAAPGTLLSILGRRLERVSAAGLTAPVLGSSEVETQIQVPFEATGATLALSMDWGGTTRTFGVPLKAVSPAIFIDRDGAPLLLDADGGLALDAGNPAKSGARVQILATGLGVVTPAWPTGVAAPVDNPPKVAAPVKVWLDREAVEVTRATLAPGFTGFYLIEIQLPAIVNAGPAELYVEAGGQASNRVRLYLAP